MSRSAIVSLGLFTLAALLSTTVRAECGGAQQCIAVSIDPSVAPSHGTPRVSAPVDFGNQTVSTSSPGRIILVAAVLGPVGTLATLDAITLSGVDAADFNIGGNTCITGTPSLLHNGTRSASLADTCAITVNFTPSTLGTKSAEITVQTTRITRTVPLTGVSTLAVPAASPATLTAERNRPTSIDLAPLVSGAVDGLRILTAPTNGIASLSGTVLTYTPNSNYVGPDSLTYESFNSAQSSGPATVSVSVVARANPADDPAVVGLVSAHTQTMKRFSQAQISNFQRRMRSLHHPSAGEKGRDSAERSPSVLLASLVTEASTGSLDLANVGASVLPEGMTETGVWLGGSFRFGRRDQMANGNGLRFSTDGISAGIDRQFRENLLLGLGLGFARDETDVGFDGTSTDSSAWSVAGYGSYQPVPDVFLDAVFGYGITHHDQQRFVASTGTFARAERDGDQLFASLSAGYEYRTQAVLLGPYARLDYAHDELEQATETGGGTDSLTFLERDFSTLRLAAGVRAESTHAIRFGWVRPRAFIEYWHDLEGGQTATLIYADEPDGPRFSVTPSAIDRNGIYAGLGGEFILRNGTRFGLDYEVQFLSSLESSQAIRFWLSKELDGRSAARLETAPSLFKNPVNVQAGYSWDDNLNRAREPDTLYDHRFDLGVSQAFIFPISSNSRFIARWRLEGTKFQTYSGLDNFSGDVQGKLQYRPSGSFGAPTFGLFARAAYDEFTSAPRDGHRYIVGIDFSKSLTDRIHAYAALERSSRNANAAVFDGDNYSARVNLDYSLGRSGNFYIGGEYREGDTVSATSAPLTANSMADDAYDGRSLFASRYEARTVLFKLGYNWPLGNRDSIDLSWTRAHSEPTGGQSFLSSGPYGVAGASRSYSANRYSIFYLMRF